MPDPCRQKILVVDDDPAIRNSTAVFLHANGYEVLSATDGYDALWQLKNRLVDIVISDLEMPGLSRLEFLSVMRQRFPEILVVAMSGRAEDGSQLPTLPADAFYPKGHQRPQRLLSMIAGLLRNSSTHTKAYVAQSCAGVITTVQSAAARTPHVLLTCPECLRSLSIAAVEKSASEKALEVRCVFCGNKLGYVVASVCLSNPAGAATTPKHQEAFALAILYASARRFAAFMLHKCRDFRRGLGSRTIRCDPRAHSSSGIPGEHENTRHSPVRNSE